MASHARWYSTGAMVFQLLAEALLVVVAVMFAIFLRGISMAPLPKVVLPAVMFAIAMVALQWATGLYRRNRRLGFGAYAGRLLLCLLIAAPIVYFTADLLPGGERFKQVVSDSVLIAFAGLLVARQLVIWPLQKLALPSRVLVLGIGPEARLVEASLTSTSRPGMQVVGFYALEQVQETAVPAERIVARSKSLQDTVRRLGVDEIIVAVRQQRGGVLPLKDLLECRLSGVRVTDLARFFERVHGQIPIEALKVSWLIYGNGFRQDWLRTTVKRTFDVVVSLILLVVTLPLMVLAALIIFLESGAPVIYRQERVGLRGRTFSVLKFRSMRQDAEKDGKAKWATVNDGRITSVGRFLRRSRIDELPQLINVLRGEMSFVGPRPERPVFVSMLTEQIPFYAVRHSIKPGITGWAQVRYSYGADVEQSMRKLEYDLYYVKNHTLLLDLRILLETVSVVLLGKGAR